MSDSAVKFLITGGAQGIGAATPRMCFSRRDRADRPNESVANKSPRRFAQTAAHGVFQARCARFGAVATVIKAIQTRYARLDGVVCAAGILRGAFQSPKNERRGFRFVPTSYQRRLPMRETQRRLLELRQGVFVGWHRVRASSGQFVAGIRR